MDGLHTTIQLTRSVVAGSWTCGSPCAWPAFADVVHFGFSREEFRVTSRRDVT